MHITNNNKSGKRGGRGEGEERERGGRGEGEGRESRGEGEQRERKRYEMCNLHVYSIFLDVISF